MPMNALARPWQFDVPDINRLFQPIQQGLSDYRRADQQRFENDRQNRLLQFQEEQQQRAAQMHPLEMMRLQQQNEEAAAAARRSAEMFPHQLSAQRSQRDVQASQADLHRAHAEYYRARAQTDARQRWVLDPQRGVMVDRTTGEQRPIGGDQGPGQFAGYGLDEHGNMTGPGVGRVGVPPPGAPPPPPDPARLPVPAYVPRGAAQLPVPGTAIVPSQGASLPGRMNLGGPTADIERTTLPPRRMGLDGWQEIAPGVEIATPPRSGERVAQIAGFGTGLTDVDPDIMNVLQRSRELEAQLGKAYVGSGRSRQQGVWITDQNGIPQAVTIEDLANRRRPPPPPPLPPPPPPPPSPVEVARQRSFGPLGLQAGDVHGIVTTPKGVTDQTATRAAAGQRAFEDVNQTAHPDNVARAEQYRLQQAYWTHMHGKPARAGYYYDQRGLEKSLAEPRNTEINERQLTALAERNFGLIDQAHDTLKKSWWLERALGGLQTQDGFIGAFANVPRAIFNTGDTAQAFADFKQIAMQPAYILSGKAVAVAEMRNFIDAYGPRPNDSAHQIALKVDRVKEFYRTLLEARRRKGDDLDVGDIQAAQAAIAGRRSDAAEPPGQSRPATGPAQKQPPPSRRLHDKYGLE